MKVAQKFIATVILAPLMGFCFSLHAQNLEQQYTDMLDEAGNYQDYKVIKRTSLNEFWNLTKDTLTNLTDNIDQLNNEVKVLNGELSQLKDQLKSQEAQIENLNEQIDSMNVLGISLGKSTYVILSFSVVLLLLVIITLGYITFKDALRTARKRSEDYDQLHEDFEEYKRSNLEKQMKLRRELQTERNKLQEVRNK